MANGTTQPVPTIFKQENESAISVYYIHENELTTARVEEFMATCLNGTVGIAPSYGSKCRLSSINLATLSCVLSIRLRTDPQAHPQKSQFQGRQLLQRRLLCNPGYRKFAFNMHRLATSLYLDAGLRITGGTDLLSVPVPNSCRQSLQAIMDALGGEITINKTVVVELFKHQESSKDLNHAVQQAWAACRVANLASMAPRLTMSKTVGTLTLKEKFLRTLAQILRDHDLRVTLKPTRVKNDTSAENQRGTKQLHLLSDRFKTRIRKSGDQTIEVETKTANGRREVTSGRATEVTGRAATINLRRNLPGKSIVSVSTVGREALTAAESDRENIVLQLLTCTATVADKPLVLAIWPSLGVLDWSKAPISWRPPLSVKISHSPLNESQWIAVQAIISGADAKRITLIQGPPGTGKTTVIAAAVISIISSGNTRTLWLVAHSNVAVKNIAEKLADVGFLDFKLLVSHDFHFDWHEHLYESIQQNLIRSDEFPRSVVAAENRISGSKVILCTLSMLSNPKLGVFTCLVPVETVIADEASQIEVGDFLPMLFSYSSTLRKLAFIGDDKQLAPHGQDDLGSLKSIFEMKHLRQRAVFLDTQYRMPVPTGNFISAHVYGGRLKTVHQEDHFSACRLVDISSAKEKKSNTSWMNLAEIKIIVKIAKRYHSQKKSYRIITPYDAQRNALEKALNTEKLPWKDKCFNVDSFQGNEDDHIIISIVRSDKIGFLANERRVNVMLTRCKKSMIICTSRAFLKAVARSTLVGKLALCMGDGAWLTTDDVFAGQF